MGQQLCCTTTIKGRKRKIKNYNIFKKLILQQVIKISLTQLYKKGGRGQGGRLRHRRRRVENSRDISIKYIREVRIIRSIKKGR